jgi:multiple sugar transport system ATP-binding protein
MDLFNNPVNVFVAGFIGSPQMNQFDAIVAGGDAGPTAMLEGTRIALPRLPALQGAEGREIVVGIRPEHVSIQKSDKSSPLPFELDLIETLGSEALLHTHVGTLPFVIKTETHGDLKHLNGLNEAHINPDLIRVFDRKTGKAIGHRQDV